MLDKGEKIDPQNLKIYKYPSADDLASGPDWLFERCLIAHSKARFVNFHLHYILCEAMRTCKVIGGVN
jgi:hypothetical protein